VQELKIVYMAYYSRFVQGLPPDENVYIRMYVCFHARIYVYMHIQARENECKSYVYMCTHTTPEFNHGHARAHTLCNTVFTRIQYSKRTLYAG
jgi:hypothetical protein